MEYQPVPSVGKRADPAVLEDILGITYDLTMEEPVIASHLPWQLYEVELDLMTKTESKNCGLLAEHFFVIAGADADMLFELFRKIAEIGKSDGDGNI